MFAKMVTMLRQIPLVIPKPITIHNYRQFKELKSFVASNASEGLAGSSGTVSSVEPSSSASYKM